jgi:RNA polymerase sigma factor (TIGR02999 family)
MGATIDDPSTPGRSVSQPGQVTQLLHALREGDQGAFDRLVQLVYDELRRVARRQLKGAGRGRTLNTTALVHEAYLKMAGQEGLDLENSHHLLAVSARAMRQVIIDFARSRGAVKRGGEVFHTTLDEEALGVDRHAEGLLDLDRSLDRLRGRDRRLAAVVECRFFAGLSE